MMRTILQRIQRLQRVALPAGVMSTGDVSLCRVVLPGLNVGREHQAVLGRQSLRRIGSALVW